ncbi:MAG: hypothetical protein ACOC7T_04765 [Planctomycetota bacterium]
MARMAERTVVIVYERCEPGSCDPERGRCAACEACPKGVLSQFDRFEPPMTVADLCRGCRDCVEACPLAAVRVVRR